MIGDGLMTYPLSAEDTTGLEIAIIGMAGRFPGAGDVGAFWRNLCAGVESITFFSDADLAPHVPTETLRDPNYVKARGALADIEGFDAALFGFSPREAEVMDPQQRLFLECAWTALEHAGYNPDAYSGLIGVYAGASMSTYLLNNLLPNREVIRAMGGYQVMIGNDKDYLATQVCYKLNLGGPGVVVQSACSTSLVAVFLACQGLLSGSCDMALAGGVSIRLPQQSGHVYQEGGIIAPDGHCRAFDAQARGMIGGNGLGIVALKRLENALADGDRIYAVIKGAAINNDGALKVGYTAPSVEGQAKVIADAHTMAEVDPDTIAYVEAHGTGTPLGDPIEVAALTRAFRAGTRRNGFCAIGSVKTNIGHLDAAAGIAGLIKAVLALDHQMLPPSLHFTQPNPQIDFANSPFYVNTTLSEWKSDGIPRRAGVSSFGIGGTNAHVVLEEAPAVGASGPGRPCHLLALSAATEAALETMTTNMAAHLSQRPDLNPADLAYTLQVGRRPLRWRRTLVYRDLADAAQALAARDPRQVLTAPCEAGRRPVAFLFPGQGAQYVEMACGLYEAEPVFRAEVDRCAEILRPHLGLDMREALYPAGGVSLPASSAARSADDLLNQTWLTQPALFIIEYALARLWMAWGVQPQAMLGHSVGEYVAACLAGVFALEDALALVAARGRLIQQLPDGAMLSVPLAAEELQPLLTGSLALAAVNAPSLCVISGAVDDVERIERALAGQGLSPRRLHVSHAFHSAMMDPILDSFREQVRRVALQPPAIPYLSNVTGTWIAADEATDPEYWVRHLRQTVRFADGVGELLREPGWLLLEVGPGRTLTTLVRRQREHERAAALLTSLRAPTEEQQDTAFLMNTIGRLWLAGAAVDWPQLYTSETRRRLPLPTYPFEHQRYWIEPNAAPDDGQAQTLIASAAPHQQSDRADWLYIPYWKPVAPPLTPPDAPRRRWLVFGDEGGLGARLAYRLEQAGCDVVVVEAGSVFARLSRRAYVVHPRQRGDYDALLAALRADDWAPDGVVHLWSLVPSDQPLAEMARFERAQTHGFYSLIALAQTLGRQRQAELLPMWVVTAGAQAVGGELALHAEQATAVGLCTVISQEYPHLSCHAVDITLPAPETWQERRLLGQLLAELNANRAEALIAYREQQRWARRFEAIRPDEAEGSIAPLREGGVYLILDGLTGIGLALAEEIARHTRGRMILVAPAPFPSCEQWADWLAAHPADDAVSRKIRSAQALEAAGAHVLVYSADLSKPEQLGAAITAGERRFGALDGVIHAAGVAGEKPLCPIEELDEAACAPHMHARAYSMLALAQAIEGRSLDFCFVQSSLTDILGGLGAAADAATSMFAAAFAQRQNRAGSTPWAVVSWDRWRLDEAPGRQPGRVEAHIGRDEGVATFWRICALGLPAWVVVSTDDPQNRIEQWVSHTAERDGAMVRADSSRHPRPNLPNAYIAPSNAIERSIAEIWQDLLGVEPIGTNDNFFDLGGHSLLATQLMARLRAAFQVELPLRSIFESATVTDVAMLIAQKQAEQVDKTRLARLLAEIKHLSPEELQARLAAQQRPNTQENTRE